MHIIRTMFLAMGLTLACAPAFAAAEECDHAWGAGHEHENAARFGKHMAKLHDALKLTSAQEAAWTEFSDKIKPRNMDKTGMDKSRRQDWKNMSTPDRLDKMLDNMKSRETKMSEHAAAVRTFYAALTQDQQKIFDRRFEEFQRHRHGPRPHDKNNAMQDKSNAM